MLCAIVLEMNGTYYRDNEGFQNMPRVVSSRQFSMVPSPVSPGGRSLGMLEEVDSVKRISRRIVSSSPGLRTRLRWIYRRRGNLVERCILRCEGIDEVIAVRRKILCERERNLISIQGSVLLSFGKVFCCGK